MLRKRVPCNISVLFEFICDLQKIEWHSGHSILSELDFSLPQAQAETSDPTSILYFLILLYNRGR